MLCLKISAIVFAVLVLQQELFLPLEREGLLLLVSGLILMLLTHELIWIKLDICTSHVVIHYIPCNIIVIII